MLKDDYEGSGSMEDFVADSNKVFSSINNAEVIVPQGYAGIEPTVSIQGEDDDLSLVFDFGDALIFTLNNVVWNLTGTAAFVSNSVSVVNGRLMINVEANSIP